MIDSAPRRAALLRMTSALGALALTALAVSAQQPAQAPGAAATPERRQGAQVQGRGGAANFDSVDVKSLHVQGNVWMLTAGPFNAAVQIGDDGVLVVDTMVEPLADKLIAEIKRLAGDKPIRYIVNTHVHADHT